MPPPMTGRVIAGRYNLQHPIGQGAMGVVWRARDELLERDVAVKEVVISAMIGTDERRNAYQRTLREARTAARLSHRGVVAVYDVAEEDGRPWIIMELVPSHSLDQILTVDGRLSALRAARIGQQLLSALAHAHAAGVLHRDVKPSNVLIATDRTGSGWEERAVLTDFGIAQFEGDPRLTQTGMVMGSPGFTAPERIRGGDATPASDLWSLGATLYAAVEGRGPYEKRGGAITTMSAIINEDAPAAPHAGQFAPLIAALMRREPRERPSAAAAAIMFSQILPLLAGGMDRPRAASHPPTIGSPAAPPARPVTSAAVSPAAPAAPDAAADQPGPAPAPESAAEPTPTTPDNPKPALARNRSAADIPGAVPAVAGADGASADDEGAAGPVSGSAASVAGGVALADVPDAGDQGSLAAAGPNADEASADEAGADEAGDGAEDAAIGADPVAGQAERAAEAEAAGNDAGAEAAERDGDDAAGDDADATRDVPAADASGDNGNALAAHAAGGGARDTAEAEGDNLDVPVAVAGAGAVAVVDGTEAREPLTFVDGRQAIAGVSIPAERSGHAGLHAPRPIPTFTAAKPGERPALSAAPPGSAGYRPAPAGWPQSGRSQSERSQSGRSQSGWAPPDGKSQGWAGQPGPSGTTPMREGSTSHPGPFRVRPDLAAQYPPGTGGGQTARTGKRGRRRLAAVIAGAVIVVASIGAGTAYALGHIGNSHLSNASNSSVTLPANTPLTVVALDQPSRSLPAGWKTYAVTAAQAGTTAGFSVDLPPGWTEQRSSRDRFQWDFYGPGYEYMEIDLTKHTYSDMLTEARYIERRSEPTYPGYHRLRLDREPVRGTSAAFWKFTFDSAAGGKLQANDILFIKPTPAGAQSYAILFQTKNATWNRTVPLWEKILRTFQTVPASSS